MPPFTLHPHIEADSLFLRDLPLCQLRLQNQSAVPWLILIPRRAEMRELHHLKQPDQIQAMAEITMASQALETLYKPDKINVAALGNMVPQLHIHVIGRFKTDPAWPQPVWGRLDAATYSSEKLVEIHSKFQTAIWQ